jgi:L-lactate dehydrogenase complex protein LldG
MVAAPMSTAREEILARIRSTTRGAPVPVERSYRRASSSPRPESVALFHERTADYRADVRRIEESEVPATIAAVCAARGARRLAVPAGLPRAWQPQELELVEDIDLDPRSLDALDGVITGCTLGIAETGTIVLTAGPGEGRRALTLVPDLHICVVRSSEIVHLVPEAIACLGEIVASEPRPVTFISGPSATSDIELSRVEGVHGPRDLVVLILGETE